MNNNRRNNPHIYMNHHHHNNIHHRSPSKTSTTHHKKPSKSHDFYTVFYKTIKKAPISIPSVGQYVFKWSQNDKKYKCTEWDKLLESKAITKSDLNFCLKRIHSLDFLDPESRTSKVIQVLITLIIVVSMFFMISSILKIIKSAGRNYLSDVLFLVSILGLFLSCFLYFISYQSPEAHTKKMEIRTKKLLEILNELNAQFLGKRNCFWKMGPSGAFITFHSDYSVNVALQPNINGLSIVQDGVDIMDEERRRSIIRGFSFIFSESAKSATFWKKKILSLFVPDDKKTDRQKLDLALELTNKNANMDKESIFRRKLRQTLAKIQEQPKCKIEKSVIPKEVNQVIDKLGEKNRKKLLKDIEKLNPSKQVIYPKRDKNSISSIKTYNSSSISMNEQDVRIVINGAPMEQYSHSRSNSLDVELRELQKSEPTIKISNKPKQRRMGIIALEGTELDFVKMKSSGNTDSPPMSTERNLIKSQDLDQEKFKKFTSIDDINLTKREVLKKFKKGAKRVQTQIRVVKMFEKTNQFESITELPDICNGDVEIENGHIKDMRQRKRKAKTMIYSRKIHSLKEQEELKNYEKKKEAARNVLQKIKKKQLDSKETKNKLLNKVLKLKEARLANEKVCKENQSPKEEKVKVVTKFKIPVYTETIEELANYTRPDED